METELNWEDNTAPGRPLGANGVTTTSNDNKDETTSSAQDGVTARDDEHGARPGAPNVETQVNNPPREHPWAPPGDPVFTTREARLYFYDHYDMLLQTRRIQKFTDKKYNNPEHRKLTAEVEPKKGGGVHLLIARSSIDQFGNHKLNQHYRNAHEAALDRNDPDFEDLRKIASRKPFAVPINADVSDTPPGSPSGAEPQPTVALDNNISTEQQDAKPSPTVTPQDAVSLEQYDELKQSRNDYRDLFMDERTKREEAESKRDQERQELQGELRRTREEKDEVISDHGKTVEAYYAQSAELRLMKAAYNEARQHLPPDTQLSIDINSLHNPNQDRLPD